jgi:hypothetical protein
MHENDETITERRRTVLDSGKIAIQISFENGQYRRNWLKRCEHRVSNNYLASQDWDFVFKTVKREDLLYVDICSFAVDVILQSSQPALEDLVNNVPLNGLKSRLNPVNSFPRRPEINSDHFRFQVSEEKEVRRC